MILTHDEFSAICQTLWGDDWQTHAARHLERSRRHLYNLKNGQSNISAPLRRRLLQIIDEQITVLQGWRSQIDW